MELVHETEHSFLHVCGGELLLQKLLVLCNQLLTKVDCFDNFVCERRNDLDEILVQEEDVRDLEGGHLIRELEIVVYSTLDIDCDLRLHQLMASPTLLLLP